jgi:hypothetical protein
MLDRKGDAIDLALANWLIAADIPQFSSLTRQDYFAHFNALVEKVQTEITQMQEVAASKGKDLNSPEIRCAIFCNAIIRLKFSYVDAFRKTNITDSESEQLHADPNNTLFAGLLLSGYGSCVSMPMLYVTIGQRLGMPIRLVCIGKHYFARWEERGYRVDIETTATDKVWVTSDDSVYMEEEGLTRAQLHGSDLRSLSNREVLGQLFFERSAYWIMAQVKSRSRSWADLSRAHHLCPDDPVITKTYTSVFKRFRITPQDTLTSLQQKERNLL